MPSKKRRQRIQRPTNPPVASPRKARPSHISFHPLKVTNSHSFAGHFKPGDRILNVHLGLANPLVQAALLHALPRLFPEMKADGYKGLFGDTPNASIIRRARKAGAIIFPAAPKRTRKVLRALRSAEKYLNHSKRYLKEPVMRIVFVFN